MKTRQTLLLCMMISALSLNSGCKSTKNASHGEAEKPSWMTERPVNPDYYYGVGSAPRRGSSDLYRRRAMEKALSDIAGQISMHINSNVSMYRVEDHFGVREVIENRIKAESENFIEGHEIMDEYEDENVYHVIYRLSKATYLQKRAERREKAIQIARENYLNGSEKASKGDYSMAVKHLVEAMETIHPFAGEGTIIAVNNDSVNLITSPPELLKKIFGRLSLEANPDTVETQTLRVKSGAAYFQVVDHLDRPVAETPILFDLSGGYLISNRSATNKNGRCDGPGMNLTKNSTSSKLTGRIDFYRLVSKHTEDIGIRNMVKDWPGDEVGVVVKKP